MALFGNEDGENYFQSYCALYQIRDDRVTIEDSINSSGVKSIYTSFIIDGIVLPEEEEVILKPEIEPTEPIEPEKSVWENILIVSVNYFFF